MSEFELPPQHTISEVSPGEPINIQSGVPTIIGRHPSSADYIEQKKRNECNLASLVISDPNIAKCLSRAALIISSENNTITVSVPQKAANEVTAINVSKEPEHISSGQDHLYEYGHLDSISLRLGDHAVLLKLSSTSTNGNLQFLFEVDPKKA